MNAMKVLGRNWIIGMMGLVALAIGVGGITATAQEVATIHGKVIDAAGNLYTHGDVKLTQDHGESKDFKYKYSFPIQPDGTYTGTGIVPGEWSIIVVIDGKTPDYQLNVPLKGGADREVTFDMTRKEYYDKMTPEERKAVEDYKRTSAAAIAANKTVANLNALLAQARADNKAGNYAAALKSMTDATAAKPEEGVLWATLGDAQLGLADAAAKAAKAAGTSPQDASILDQYTTAAASYQKAIDLNAASKKPIPELAAAAYNQLGQCYGKAGKTKEAAAAYEQAAQIQPAGAAMYFFNEAATLFNSGDTDDAAAAADKAIAADPTRAESYYIKGQSLVTKASVDPKTNAIVAPPGCIEAYQKYLQLDPQGRHAKDVEDILTGFGQKIESSYKATKKKS